MIDGVKYRTREVSGGCEWGDGGGVGGGEQGGGELRVSSTQQTQTGGINMCITQTKCKTQSL